MSRALGRYELLRPLARGGMAEVYLARRRTAGIEKWLVVKRIRPERSGDARFLDLFVREAKLSMSLVHQNIVPVFDFGRIDDQVFLAMERVEGRDLGSTLARAPGRRVAPLIAAFIAAECCQALDYAHHRKSPEGAVLGIVHRDVTPRNVLLSWSGEVKLTDFGIAALAGDATAKLLGTPAYMAPEQARSEALDARADVYAVGLLLREMLTGQRARPGTERDQYIEAAKTGTMLPWPEDLRTPLIAIVDRATSIQPEDRFPDARTMLAELDSVIVSERAARKSEAPARLLASWLEDVWSGDRDDVTPDPSIEANHLVSFLDDGQLDAIGTGTERSLLATAADELSVSPSGTKQTPAILTPAPDAVSAAAPTPAGLASNPGLRSTPELAPSSSTTGSQSVLPERRGGKIAIALMVVGGVGLGALGMQMLRADSPSESRVTTAPLPPPQPATKLTQPVTNPTVKPPVANPPASPPVNPPLANPPEAGSDAVAIAAGSGSVRARPPTGQQRPPTGQTRPKHITPTETTPVEVAVQPVTQRRVTINATPWAYFTIDDNNTQHETMKTVMLAPGKHLIHFTNPVLKVERDVTIDVPADRDTSHVERLGN